MPSSIPSMAVQKKKTAIPPVQGPLSTHTTDNKRKGNRHERMGDNIKPKSQTRKPAYPVKKSVQLQMSTAVANGPNIDERLKAARERREEQQKLLASRELNRLEREQRARQYYEQQMQERKKKLLEQRLKEERRRAAVEEKRMQRLKEEKERYESAVRKTQEKSHRAQQNQNARGRKLTNTISFHSMNATTTTTITPQKPQSYFGSAHNRSSASPSSQHRSNNLAQNKSVREQAASKKNSNRGLNTRSPPANTRVKPVTKSRTASPSPERTIQRTASRHSTPLQLELPSVPEEDVSVCSSALSPGNSRSVRTSAESQKEKMRNQHPPETLHSDMVNIETDALTRTDESPCKTPPASVPQPPQVMCKPSAGTSDPEEASRAMAEKRREARLQREREAQERLQREEAERRCLEELEHKRAEERAQQAEAQRLIEEKRRREEEEQRRAEEERAQAMREAALLQKQREEEQAKERAKAEQIRREREILAQKEEAARHARKKRLEEIMRRTRRTDSPDTKSLPVKTSPNEAQPKENTEPVHGGTIENVVTLPVGTKTSQLGLNNEEDMLPVVAFKERRSLRNLAGLEEIQTHQRAEVI